MLEINETVLAVIDVQGKLARLAHDHEKLLKQIERLIRVAKLFKLPMLWSEQAPDKIGETVQPIKRLLSEASFHCHSRESGNPDFLAPIVKKSLSCFSCDAFVKELTKINRRQILLTGIETHVCIYQTAHHLNSHGYDVYVIADAVSSRDIFDHNIALERMRQEGMTITSTEMTICELLKTTQHPAFKEILSEIKR